MPFPTRFRRPLALAAQVALLALAGCASGPPIAEVTPFGVIRATDRGAAAILAPEFLEFRTEIIALLPDTREGPVNIWLEERPTLREHGQEDGWADAYTLTWGGSRTPRVHLPADPGTDAERRNLIAHELVHALLGPSWQSLPTALEEGLATWVATQIEPRSYQRVTKLLAAAPDRMAHIELGAVLAGAPVALPDRALTLAIASASDASVEEILAYPLGDELYPSGRAAKLRLYGVGLALVDTIVRRGGIGALHGLCLRAEAEGLARVPIDWIMEAAGATTPEGRRLALRPPLRPEDALWLVDHRDLWPRLARAYRALRSGESQLATTPEAFIDALELEIEVDRGAPISWRQLALYPQLRAELTAELELDPTRLGQTGL
ncbi:hypothetical protein [Engelhardtia mirabilis]|uniref:Peptidase MA-like domain-containing protein n=1 Tax=Engelhardtia mirabilis TaxID=2528011 RepID=A0A518BHI5_9BACT|nr:hypothetical protein Pla133_15130 [Planctomycetes bacterium Pla133]QDV00765.1 hypothetical protein Pla86_15120 [Planctomycetes bacterium Pla86]